MMDIWGGKTYSLTVLLLFIFLFLGKDFFFLSRRLASPVQRLTVSRFRSRLMLTSPKAILNAFFSLVLLGAMASLLRGLKRDMMGDVSKRHKTTRLGYPIDYLAVACPLQGKV